jgi:hypothetical protein
MNYRQIGNEDSARLMILIGVALDIGAAVAALAAPSDFPNSVIPAVYCGALGALAWHFQRGHYASHLQSGGSPASFWRSLRVALLCLPITLATFFAVIETVPLQEWNRVPFGDSEIYYERGTSLSDAQEVGSFLTDAGFFGDDLYQSVTLRGGGQTLEVRVLVGDEEWENPEVIAAYTELLSALRAGVYPSRSVELHLCNVWGFSKHVVR